MRTPTPPRRTQAERRAQSRQALLDAAARGLARDGYRGLVLDRVAHEAGYTRGALYHLFADKEALALAVVERTNRTWRREVGLPAAAQANPVDALVVLARGHAVYCRKDFARLLMVLRVELGDQDNPVGQAVASIIDDGIEFVAALIATAREQGLIAPDPPARVLAEAYFGAIEGVGIQLANQIPHDEELAERVALGVLGVRR